MCGERYKNKITAFKEFIIYENRYDIGTHYCKEKAVTYYLEKSGIAACKKHLFQEARRILERVKWANSTKFSQRLRKTRPEKGH